MKLYYIFIFLFTATCSLAQDTIIVNNNYKYKIGIKPTTQGSSDLTQEFDGYYKYYQAWRVGIQLIKPLTLKSKSSIETGVYYTTKVKQYRAFYYYPYGKYWLALRTGYVSIPVNYRYDTKVIYFSGGIFVDYLVDEPARYYINSIYDYGIDRKWNAGYNISLGVEKQINRELNFFVEGSLFHTVSWPKEEAGHSLIERGLKTTYHNYGIAVGINYKIITTTPSK